MAKLSIILLAAFLFVLITLTEALPQSGVRPCREICPLCDVECEFGPILDRCGCGTCRCYNPCMRCTASQICRVIPGVCSAAPTVVCEEKPAVTPSPLPPTLPPPACLVLPCHRRRRCREYELDEQGCETCICVDFGGGMIPR